MAVLIELGIEKSMAVSNPAHYTQGKVECIEALRSALSDSEYRGFLKGNILKYIWREQHKNGIQDLKKAQWYLSELINHEQEKERLSESET